MLLKSNADAPSAVIPLCLAFLHYFHELVRSQFAHYTPAALAAMINILDDAKRVIFNMMKETMQGSLPPRRPPAAGQPAGPPGQPSGSRLPPTPVPTPQQPRQHPQPLRPQLHVPAQPSGGIASNGTPGMNRYQGSHHPVPIPGPSTAQYAGPQMRYDPGPPQNSHVPINTFNRSIQPPMPMPRMMDPSVATAYQNQRLTHASMYHTNDPRTQAFAGDPRDPRVQYEQYRRNGGGPTQWQPAMAARMRGPMVAQAAMQPSAAAQYAYYTNHGVMLAASPAAASTYSTQTAYTASATGAAQGAAQGGRTGVSQATVQQYAMAPAAYAPTATAAPPPPRACPVRTASTVTPTASTSTSKRKRDDESATPEDVNEYEAMAKRARMQSRILPTPVQDRAPAPTRIVIEPAPFEPTNSEPPAPEESVIPSNENSVVEGWNFPPPDDWGFVAAAPPNPAADGEGGANDATHYAPPETTNTDTNTFQLPSWTVQPDFDASAPAAVQGAEAAGSGRTEVSSPAADTNSDGA